VSFTSVCWCLQQHSLTDAAASASIFVPSMATSVSPWAAAHANPQGAGDGRPTAMDIIRHEGLIGRWRDKIILMTGATAGLGLETARALYRTGAHLFLPVRDLKRGEEAVQDILRAAAV
jgi:hypothetical protein